MKLNIFISCFTEESNDKKWIAEFSDTIKILISKVHKRDVEITTSNNLANDDKFSKLAPVDVFSNMDVFFIVLSKKYLESTKLKQELATIASVTKGSNNKIFKILVDDIPQKEQTDDIKELLPVILYVKDDFKTTPIDLEKVENYQPLRNYWLRLIDLAYNICVAKTEISTAKTIYLAHTGADQFSVREIIRRELLHFGHTVLPPKLLSDNKEGFQKEVLEYVGKSDITIHIIGSDDGKILDDKKSVTFQNEIASGYCETKNKSLKRLIWIPPDLVFDNDNQRINIEKLKRDSKTLVGAELLQTPIEDFKTLVHKRINIINNGANADDTQTRTVYLINIEKSQESIEEISSLLNKSDISTLFLDKLTDKRQLLRNHKDNLMKCDGVIIFTDGNNNGWVESMQKDIIKSVGFGRKKPILIQSIYKTTKKEVKNSFSDQFQIIDGASGISDNLLKPFVDELIKE